MQSKPRCGCPPNFKLIHGGLHWKTALGALQIVAAPEQSPPFALDAVVHEEDTWLVMSAEPQICEMAVHPIRLMTEMMDAKPERVATILTREGNPVQFMAVVYDVNQDPIVKAQWVDTALQNLFRESESRQISAMKLPLLGVVHGHLPLRRFTCVLSRVLRRTALDHLRRLWLTAPVGMNRKLIETLDKQLTR